MRKTIIRHKTLIIIAAAVLLAGIGFASGMMAKESLAEKNKDIGLESAKEIALSSVGVSAEKATFTKAEFDGDSYEIDFYTENNEYDFDIDPKSGAILDSDVSQRESDLPESDNPEAAGNEQPTQQKNDDSVIGVDAAKSIALKDAGLSSASFQEASLDYDDGIRVYDLEFNSGIYSYEYEINAYTGSILSYDIEGIDYDD